MPGYGFAIDRGGTFTDICVFRPDNSVKILKILSEDPANYKDAPTEAIRRVLEEETQTSIPKGTPVPTGRRLFVNRGLTAL